MVLNKRYKRNLKSSLPFYISVVFLTAISVWLFLCLASGVTCEREYLNNFNKKYKIEDGSFVTDKPVDEKKLEDKYNVSLEMNRYVNVETNNYTLRVFAPNKDINLYDVIEGKDIEDDHDILISKNFSTENKIKIGDKLTLNGIQFTVKGYCERPDYGTILKNISDMSYSNDKFGIGITKNDVIEKLGVISEYMSVRYNDKNETEFRKQLYNDYNTKSYISAKSNRRIYVADSVIGQYQAATGMILPCMLTFVVILLAVILGRKVKNDMKQIGTLSALGYKKREIVLHYMLFAVVPGLIGSIIGIVATKFTIQPVAEMIFFKLEKYPVIYRFPIAQSIVSFIAPAIAYGIAAVFTVRRLLRVDTVCLLSGEIKSKRKNLNFFIGSRMHFSRKYKLRMLIGNFSRTLVVILGIAIGGVVMLYGFSCMDSCYHYKDVQTEKIGTFKYEYCLGTINVGNVDNGETLIQNSFEVKGNDNAVQLCGTSDNPYLKLKNTEGKSIELKDGKYYMTTLAAKLYGVKKGDKLTFTNAVSLKDYKVKIDDLIDNDSQILIVTTRGTACDLICLPKDSYNIVMSNKKLNYKDDEVISTITKSSLKDQMQTSIDGMEMMMNLIIVFGCLICIISVYLMVNMLIQENITSISMLKVLGYKNSKINKMVVHVYHILVPIGTVVGFGLGYLVCTMYFAASIADFQLSIETYISFKSIMLYIICIVASYVVSLYLLQRKVLKVNMIESLKDNRE